MDKPVERSSSLKVSSYTIKDGMLELEGDAIINNANGASPEFIKLSIPLVSIKLMQHAVAWVHVALERDWYIDLLFKDAQKAGVFFEEFHGGLQDFYAAEGEGFPGDEPGSTAMGDN